MLFNSKIFLSLLALTLAIYYLLPDRGKIWFLFAISVLFYGWWDPSLLWLVFMCIGVNYAAGLGIAANRDQPRRRKAWLWFAVIITMGTLGFYKYYDFFAHELALALGVLGFAVQPDDWLLRLALPVGISFYTFQTMSYTIDLYRGDLAEPERDFVRFALFVKFFPQLVAGPVERAAHLLPQFSRPFRLSREMVYEGSFLILMGFVKKVVIADRLALIIAPAYRDEHVEPVLAAMSMLLFTCQIYVDFSSYSDIALGLGMLLGYSIRPNFNLPFVVPSIPERWRRWHLSMSEWFRDYVFIPLGGSKKGTVRTQINILIVMLLSGLWHGASNNFLVWGLGNGATMVGHRLLLRPLRAVSGLMERHPLTRWAYFYLCCWNTFCLIASINIFFRCPDWETATRWVRAIFLSGLDPYLRTLQHLDRVPMDYQRGFWWVLVVFLAHESQRWFDLKRRIVGQPLAWAAICLFFLWGVTTFGIEGPMFIYYQF